ncbi:MAG: hypothetical protein IKL13_04550 [Clostridia bacterium]|nr:hypothetical protein [Clostridia bacterium]
MKRFFALALAMALLLCGCGKENKKEEGGSKAAVKLGDTTVTVGETLTAEMKTALGEPVSVEEAPSCHFEGMDTVYRYDGFSIQTYRKEDADAIAVITVESADYPTDKGIKVGDNLDAVMDAYGEADEPTNYYWVYNLTDKVTLTFELDGDKVATILYEEKV